jgi:hypothetical protein
LGEKNYADRGDGEIGEVARKIRAFILKSKIAGLISSQGSKLKLRIDKICGLLLIYLLG